MDALFNTGQTIGLDSYSWCFPLLTPWILRRSWRPWPQFSRLMNVSCLMGNSMPRHQYESLTAKPFLWVLSLLCLVSLILSEFCKSLIGVVLDLGKGTLTLICCWSYKLGGNSIDGLNETYYKTMYVWSSILASLLVRASNSFNWFHFLGLDDETQTISKSWSPF